MHRLAAADRRLVTALHEGSELVDREKCFALDRASLDKEPFQMADYRNRLSGSTEPCITAKPRLL